MDKLKAIFQDYQEAKLLSKQTTFEQFASVDDSIKEVLYNQGIENKVISSKTDLELFKSAWAEAAIPTVKKKDEGMVSPSEDGSLDSSETEVISQEDLLQQTVTPSDQLETEPTDTQVDFELGFQNIPEQQLTEKLVSTPYFSFLSEEKDDFAGTILSEQPPKAFSEPVVQDGVSVAEEVEYDPFKESVDRVVNKELLTNDLSSFGSINPGIAIIEKFFTEADATEENVIPQMQNYFGEYGFEFEPADALGDGMTVKASNGKQTYVNLDGVFGGEQAAKDLKKFLIENKEENAVERESNKVIKENRKVYEEQEIKDAVSVFDTEAQEFHNNYVEFIKLKEFNEQMSKELVGISQSDIESNPSLKQKLDIYTQNLDAEKQFLKLVTDKSKEFKVKGARLDMLAGEYYEMKSKQGSYSSGIMAGIFGRGPANIASGAVSYGVDAYTYLAKNRSLTEEKYRDELIRIGKEEGYLPKDEDFSGLSKEEIIERLGGDTNDAKPFFDRIFLAGKQALGFDPIGKEAEKEALGEPTNFDKVNDKVKDYARKGIKYYNDYGVEGLDYDKAAEGRYRNPFSQIAANLDTEMGIVDASLSFGEKISENIGAPKEWADLEKQSFWGGAILGLSESIPAMIGGMDKIGFVQRTAQMFMMTSSHLEQEMNKNPMFDNISESEKIPMKVGLASVVAVLESLGFRNVMRSNAYIPTLILSRVLKKVPKGSTQRTLREYIQQDVESSIARGGYSLLAAGAAEFETGFAQEAADILIKNIYNDLKEKEMFETPESWGDIVFQMVYAGGQEAVGGKILGAPGAIVSAVAGRQDVQSLDERDWKNFELLSNDPTYYKMYVQKLKAAIADPENSKTLEEAQAELDSVRKIQGLLKNNKQNISNLSAEKKKRAVQLLIQQQKLEEEIKNGNKQLSKSKRELLDDVNKELENLGVESRLIEISERAKEGGIQEFKGSVIDWIKGLGKTKDIGDVMEGGIEIDMDGTKVIMTESEGGVTLESIETPDADKGKGKAEAALKKIAENADRDGVKITLKVVPKDATVNAETTQQDSDVEFDPKYFGMVGSGKTNDTGFAGFKLYQGKGQNNRNLTDKELNILDQLVNLYIEQVAKGNMTIPEVIAALTRRGYALELPEWQQLRDYIASVTNPNVPKIGNNKDSFTDWRQKKVNGELRPSSKVKKTKTVDAGRLENLYGRNGFEMQEDGVTMVRTPKVQELTQEQKDVEALFAEDADDDVDRASNNLSINRKNEGESQSSIYRASAITSAKFAANAIKKILPNVRIVLHEAESEYLNYVTKPKDGEDVSRGEYKDNVIHINLSKVRRSTVAHEVFHAVLLDKVRNNDALAKKISDNMVRVVQSKLPENDKLRLAVENHAKKYEGDQAQLQTEEQIAELIGLLSSNIFGYTQLDSGVKASIKNFLINLAKKLRIPLPKSWGSDQEVVDLINTLARKTRTGEEITEEDVKLLDVKEDAEGGEQQGSEGEVGKIKISRQQKDVIDAPSVNNDPRPWVRKVTNTIDVFTLNGKNFITNMYDYTNAGLTELGNGYSIELLGGRNYVPIIMNKTGKKLGDVSNLAAFNTKSQAEGFVRQSIEGDANYFAPHSGTLDGSWQFQQHIFEQLVDLVLDNNILSDKELISSFNQGLVRTPKALESLLNKYKKDVKSFNKKGYYLNENKERVEELPLEPTRIINALEKFLNKYNEEQSKEGSNLPKLKNTENLNDFLSNPKELVKLLNIENNFSPDLRKRLNQKIAANKKFQKAIGVKNLEEFHQRIIDPLNKGVVGGEIMTFIKFDPSTFEIVKTDPTSVEHHPSFGWVVKAKIEEISQPEKFHKSYDITEEYIKYNSNETVVSRKADVTEDKFKKSNVSSSAGSIPKVAKVATRQQRTDRLAPNGKRSNLNDEQYDIVRTPAFKNWFGDWESDPANASKVVDENGEPMVLYHGTNSPEGVFERGFDKENKNLTSRKIRDRNNWFWFSNNKEVASTYGTKVLDVFVSSKDMLSKPNTNLDQLYREAVKSNKDGLVMRDVADTLSDTRYIVFDNQRHYVDDKGSTGYFADELLPSETQEEIIEQIDAQIRYYEKEIGLDKLEEYEKEELQFNLDLKDFIEKNGKDAVTITERIKGDIYGIDNPTQIKSADGTNTTFDPSKPSIRQQKGIQQAMENGEVIQTDSELIFFKGMQPKMKNGKPFSVHKIKKGSFAALDKNIALDYKGDKPLKQFTIPEGTTVEVVNLPSDEISIYRRNEEKAIDASDAQVVKLVTIDSRGKSQQYVIKDDAILKTSKDVKEETPATRQQKSINDYISKGRGDNIPDDMIRDFLVRVKRFPTKKVDELLSLEVSLFDNLPSSFGNIKGGAKVGVKLYEKVEKFRIKEQKRNNKRKNKLTEQEIIDKTIEFLEKQPEYINEGDTYTIGKKKDGTQKTLFRKGISTQQATMLIDIQKSIGIRPTENMGIKIAKARLALRERKKGQIDIDKVRIELRNFIRKALPKELYERKEVLDLINKIAIANKKNINNLVKEIESFVIEVNNKSLEKKIKKILNDKYQEVKSDKNIPKKIADEVRKRIDFINKNLVSPKATPEDIGEANEELLDRFNEIMEQNDITIKEQQEMADLQLAMQYNNAMLMENSNANKVTELDGIYSTLEQMLKYGRSLLQEELRESHEAYNRTFELGYEAITGDKVDMNDPEAKKKLNNRKKKRTSDENKKKATQGVIRRFLSKIKTIIKAPFGSAEALNGLMERIDKLPGEMFGGRLNEMFTNRVDDSSRRFKMRMMQIESVIQNYLAENYGKDWEKISRNNRKQVDYNIELHDGIMLEGLSQDEIAYLYNMYKDPANRASFANPEMWGVEVIDKDDSAKEKKRKQEINQANAARVMKELESELDDKVKDFADWQVDVLYPALYEEYNNTYKKLYRTDLPWNKFYAGTIYRQGVTEDDIDVINLLGRGNMYKTAVGANATKVRQGSSLPIKPMNMVDVLNTYINDMEYFAAYGETIRDMDKFFSNKYIKSAIIDIHGSEVYTFIDDMIKKIASRGMQSSGLKAKAINAMNTAFIVSRLAFSPVIAIKQLTSLFTYANDIGFINWLEYSAKNKTQQLKVWKEISENSVYIQDRYRNSITKAIETYSDTKMKEFLPSKQGENWAINFAMYTTKLGDKGAIYLGGAPNYSYYKAQALKQGKTEQEAIDIAIKKFERDTKRTQQSSDLQDKDYLQTGDPLTRAMNMFMTTPKQYLRNEIIAVRNLYRAMRGKDYKGTVGQNVRTFVMYHVFMPVLFQYVSMGLPGILRNKRDEDKWDLLRAAVIGNLNGLFLLGEAVNTIGDLVTGKPWAGTQTKSLGFLMIMNSLIRKLSKAINYKDKKKRDKAYLDFFLELSTFRGIPAPTIAKFFDNYSKLGSEEDVGKIMLRLLNYSNYQIEGSSRNKSKVKTVYELNQEYQKQKEKKNKESQKKKLGFYD